MVTAKPQTAASDLDLDEADARLREAVGVPTTVTVKGRQISISHASLWSSVAMNAANKGDWPTWAAEVITDGADLEHWNEANLRNYQIEAVFDTCGKKSKVSRGKSQRS